MDWSRGLLWCFYHLFGLSFWRHPFTAEDPLLSKWCNATFLQIWWRNKLIYCTSWMTCRWVHFQQSLQSIVKNSLLVIKKHPLHTISIRNRLCFLFDPFYTLRCNYPHIIRLKSCSHWSERQTECFITDRACKD